MVSNIQLGKHKQYVVNAHNITFAPIKLKRQINFSITLDLRQSTFAAFLGFPFPTDRVFGENLQNYIPRQMEL